MNKLITIALYNILISNGLYDSITLDECMDSNSNIGKLVNALSIDMNKSTKLTNIVTCRGDHTLYQRAICEKFSDEVSKLIQDVQHIIAQRAVSDNKGGLTNE